MEMDGPSTLLLGTLDVKKEDKPIKTDTPARLSTPLQPSADVPPPPLGILPPAMPHLLVILLPSPPPSVSMELDPPVIPPSAPALLTITETHETIATQPMEMEMVTVQPPAKTEEAKGKNAMEMKKEI